MLSITYQLKPASQRRTEQFTPAESIGFGRLRTDHMFLMEYSDGEWHSPRIVPYGSIELMPGAAVLHYAQTVFEGAKCFKHPDGELYLFRIEDNAQRLNDSCARMEIPPIPLEDQLQAIETLIDVERLWFPEQEGASLYIRPVIYATEDFLGVRESREYLFNVFLSPSGPYYEDGFKPMTLLLTTEFKRAVPKGSGKAKTGGNYASSLKAGKRARELDAKQVLYVDVYDHELEEAGAVNHYHVEKGKEIVIPEFTDTILESITARSIIDLESRLGYSVRQERISLLHFVVGVATGRITEAGGLGTAAVVSPVGSYVFDNGDKLTVGNGNIGPVTKKMYDTLTGIQTGKLEAPEGWLRKVERRAS
jgi:branched-chain amino acid aminotransferase